MARRRTVPTALLVLAGAALALVLLSRGGPQGVEVTVLRGEATGVNHDATAIGFSGERISGPRLPGLEKDEAFGVAGAQWWDGSWHSSSSPACLTPGSSRQPLELGVLEVRPSDDAPGGPVVVWLKCQRGDRDGRS